MQTHNMTFILFFLALFFAQFIHLPEELFRHFCVQNPKENALPRSARKTIKVFLQFTVPQEKSFNKGKWTH